VPGEGAFAQNAVRAEGPLILSFSPKGEGTRLRAPPVGPYGSLVKNPARSSVT
jgi:hypothetical protein